MTPPTGYVHALFAGSGAVKVPDIIPATAVDTVIPGAVLGPGDIHIVSEGEAWESSNWVPCNEGGTPLPESASPLPKAEDADAEPAPLNPADFHPDGLPEPPPAVVRVPSRRNQGDDD